MHLALAQEIRT